MTHAAGEDGANAKRRHASFNILGQEVAPPVPVITLRSIYWLGSLITGKNERKQTNLPHRGPRRDSSKALPAFSAPCFVLHRYLGGVSSWYGASDAGWNQASPRYRAAWQSRTVPWVGCCWHTLPMKTRRTWHASFLQYLFKSVTGEQNPPMWLWKGEGESNRTSHAVGKPSPASSALI